MPRGDGTGPMGYGPMTGRGLGYCAGYPAPGYVHPGVGGYGFGRGFGYGRGRGWGRGMGRGYRRGYGYGYGYGYGPAPVYPAYHAYPPYPVAAPAVPAVSGYPEIDEEEALAEEAAYLEKSLDAVRRRLKEIRGKEGKEKEGEEA